MSYNYAPILATATRLLTDFGQAATLTRTAPTDADTSTQTGVAVQVPITEGERRNLIDATLPVRKYLLNGAVTPEAGDVLAVGSDSGPIMQADRLAPGATTIIWTVIVRAG